MLLGTTSYLFFLMDAFERLPPVAGTVYRGGNKVRGAHLTGHGPFTLYVSALPSAVLANSWWRLLPDAGY